jgi:ribosome biogenesis GTPase / thiamine phosphate phosphatase
VLLANPDQALFVFAVRHPEPHRRMLDRFLVLAESQGLPAIVGVNKIDLDVDVYGAGDLPLSRSIFGNYELIYPVHYFSALLGQGLDGIRQRLKGKTTVVAGPSGVGKSSLLHALDQGSPRSVADISEATGKGRHTTTGAQLYKIGDGTFVADTPGIRSLAMHGVPVEDLEWCFREFAPILRKCFFADCKHLTEPGCAVLEAVAKGTISAARHASYVSLRSGNEEN